MLLRVPYLLTNLYIFPWVFLIWWNYNSSKLTVSGAKRLVPPLALKGQAPRVRYFSHHLCLETPQIYTIFNSPAHNLGLAARRPVSYCSSRGLNRRLFFVAAIATALTGLGSFLQNLFRCSSVGMSVVGGVPLRTALSTSSTICPLQLVSLGCMMVFAVQTCPSLELTTLNLSSPSTSTAACLLTLLLWSIAVRQALQIGCSLFKMFYFVMLWIPKLFISDPNPALQRVLDFDSNIDPALNFIKK